MNQEVTQEVSDQGTESQPRSLVVCAVDGSAASQTALAWAVDDATRRGAVLRVVGAWSWVPGGDQQAYVGMDEARTVAEAHTRNAVQAVMGQGASDVEVVVREGQTSEVLLAASIDADLLVLGSHAHSAVHDALVGSTSSRVLRHATCPVVILPSPARRERDVRRVEERAAAF